MKSKLIVASKASLLFVVLGFFLPIFNIPLAGNINGVQVANMFSEFGQASYSFLILLIPIFAVASIALTGYFIYSKNETEKPLFFIIDFCLLLFIFLCVLIPLNNVQNTSGDLSSDLSLTSIVTEVLGVGAYFAFLGWLASLLLLIVKIVVTYSESIIDFIESIIDSISIAMDKLRKKIDTLPIAVQMLIGILILALIAAVGFGVFFLVDILLLDFDPIGKIFSSLSK